MSTMLMTALTLAYVPACSAQIFSLPSKVMRESPAPTPLPQEPLARSRGHVQSWGPLFKAQAERCWKKPAGAGKQAIEAVFSIKLKPDGMIENVTPVSINANTPYAEAYLSSGLRALTACQPYKLPKEHYDEWRSFKPVFTERSREVSQR